MSVFQNVFLSIVFIKSSMSGWLRDLFSTQADGIMPDDKKTSEKIIDLLILSEDERTLIFCIVDSGSSSFVFQNENIKESDEVLKSCLKIFTSEKIISLIESLVEKSVLIREELEPALQCPGCSSEDIKVNLRCPKCVSNHVQKSEIYEHPYCGYRNIKSEFTVKGCLICPKCESKLTRRISDIEEAERETYRVIGSVFQCNSCRNKVNKPNIDFRCRNCGTEFNYINAIYQVPVKYSIPEKIFRKIRSRNKVSILIVEDFAPEAEVMSVLLDNYGSNKEYNVDIARSGNEALLAFGEKDFDLVILDLGLPDMDGLEVLEEITKKGPDVKVIVYTGHDDRETAVRAMKMGASEFLIKGQEDAQSLPKIVEKVLSERKI